MNPSAPARRRAKGPLVWLDMDQQELDDAYDQTVYAPNREEIRARRLANNEITLRVLGQPDRVAYGAAEIENLSYVLVGQVEYSFWLHSRLCNRFVARC